MNANSIQCLTGGELKPNGLSFSTNFFIACFFLIITLCVYFNNLDVFALCLALFSFSLIMLTRIPWENSKVAILYWASLLVHHVLAIVNSEFVTIKGAGADAVRFHLNAAAIAGHGEIEFVTTGPEFFENFLAVFYLVSEASIFLASELSILAYALSFIILYKLIKLLDRDKSIFSILFVFSFLPSALIHTSVPLRESFEILFAIASTYFLLKIKLSKANMLLLLLTLISTALLILLHKAMLIMVLVSVVLGYYWVITPHHNSRAFSLKGLYVFLLMGTLFLLFFITFSDNPLLTILTEGGGVEFIKHHRESTADGRATYQSYLDISSVYGVVLTIGSAFLHYMFEPFPWKISSGLDLYAFFESFFRLALLIGALLVIVKSKGERRNMYGLCFAIYITVSIIWALGTTNYGTAIRHHLTYFWMLLIIGLPPIINGFKYFMGMVVLGSITDQIKRKKYTDSSGGYPHKGSTSLPS